MKIKDASAVAFEVAMVLERETKDAVRYQELGEGGQPTDFATGRRSTLFIRKTAFPNGAPKAISVAIRKEG